MVRTIAATVATVLLGAPPASPRAMAPDGGVLITTPAELEEALRTGNVSASGQAVTPETAMRVGAVFRCVTLRSGVIATLPFQVKRRVDDRTRVNATDAPLWKVFNRRPNRWQKPHQFKRMMQAHVLVRGNAYALKVFNSRRQVIQLIPLHPDRVEVKQLDDLSLVYLWTRKDGRQMVFAQDEILHLYNLTLDGFRGVTPITYARETIGAALSMEQHGGKVFKNGANVASALKHPKKLSTEAYERLKADMADFRQGGAREGDTIILEEGMDFERMGMSLQDAAWIEGKNYSRVEIAMFFGVPPHMIGHTEGNTKLGSSIDGQTQSFLTFCVEDDLVMWEEGCTADCLNEDTEADLYTKFNRNGLVKGDIKTRGDFYVKMLMWGVYSPNRVLELEDENPREGGDIFYPPPNTAGKTGIDEPTSKDLEDA
jgi:HK97 family phage portal protein